MKSFPGLFFARSSRIYHLSQYKLHSKSTSARSFNIEILIARNQAVTRASFQSTIAMVSAARHVHIDRIVYRREVAPCTQFPTQYIPLDKRFSCVHDTYLFAPQHAAT